MSFPTSNYILTTVCCVKSNELLILQNWINNSYDNKQYFVQFFKRYLNVIL